MDFFLNKIFPILVKDDVYLYIQYKEETSEALPILEDDNFQIWKKCTHIPRKILMYLCPSRVLLACFFFKYRFCKREKEKSWEKMRQEGTKGVTEILKEADKGMKEREEREKEEQDLPGEKRERAK